MSAVKADLQVGIDGRVAVEQGQRVIRTLESIQTQAAKTRAALGNIGNLTASDGAQRYFRDHASGADMARREMERATSAVGGFNSALRELAGFAGFAGVTAGIVGIGEAAIDATLGMERIESKLIQATGSANGAAAEFGFVKEEADRLGLSLRDAADQYGSFAAASKGTALEGKAARDVFVAVSEAAAVMKLSTEESQGAFTALGQIVSKGKVQAEELRGQLGERLPGAFQIAARAMGVTTAQLDKMIEQGQVMADVFLPKFAAEMHKTFGQQAEQAADGLQGAFNRLKTATFEFNREVGQGGLADAVSDAAKAMTQMANGADSIAQRFGAELAAGVRGSVEAFRLLVDNVDLLKSALVGVAAAKAAEMFFGIATGIAAATWAMLALNVATMANPWGALATAIGVAAGAAYQWHQNAQDAEAAQTRLNTAVADAQRINAMSTPEVEKMTGALRANTVEAAKNAEAQLAMANASALSAAMRARQNLDTQKAMFPNVRTPGVVDAENAVTAMDAVAAETGRNLLAAQEALNKLLTTPANDNLPKSVKGIGSAAADAAGKARTLGDILKDLADKKLEIENKKLTDSFAMFNRTVEDGLTPAQKYAKQVDEVNEALQRVREHGYEPSRLEIEAMNRALQESNPAWQAQQKAAEQALKRQQDAIQEVSGMVECASELSDVMKNDPEIIAIFEEVFQ